jgi:hypothetical protein
LVAWPAIVAEVTTKRQWCFSLCHNRACRVTVYSMQSLHLVCLLWPHNNHVINMRRSSKSVGFRTNVTGSARKACRHKNKSRVQQGKLDAMKTKVPWQDKHEGHNKRSGPKQYMSLASMVGTTSTRRR